MDYQDETTLPYSNESSEELQYKNGAIKHLETGQNRSDIAYSEGIPSDNAMNYETKFGKVYKGERVNILFSIYNTSRQHKLDNVTLKISL